MKNFQTLYTPSILALFVALVLVVVSIETALAQNQAGTQQQDRDRDRDQVATQTDTATGTQNRTGMQTQGQASGTQMQLRTQDQDTTRAKSGGGSEQATAQGQQRAQAPQQGNPDAQYGNASGTQERLQLRVHASTSDQLRQMIQERTQTQLQLQDGSGTGTMQRSRVATQAFMAAEQMMGQNGPRMSEMATEMLQKTEAMEKNEQKLNQRNWFSRMFIGQDQDAATELKQTAEQNRAQLQEMKQLLDTCDQDCDGEAKLLLQEQIRLMDQEQDRLHTVATTAEDNRGLFGFLFGWMR